MPTLLSAAVYDYLRTTIEQLAFYRRNLRTVGRVCNACAMRAYPPLMPRCFLSVSFCQPPRGLERQPAQTVCRVVADPHKECGRIS